MFDELHGLAIGIQTWVWATQLLDAKSPRDTLGFSIWARVAAAVFTMFGIKQNKGIYDRLA